MTPELELAWPCYRAVVDGLATWTEVSTSMTIDDVDLLCMAADAITAARNGVGAGDGSGDGPRRMHEELRR